MLPALIILRFDGIECRFVRFQGVQSGGTVGSDGDHGIGKARVIEILNGSGFTNRLLNRRQLFRKRLRACILVALRHRFVDDLNRLR